MMPSEIRARQGQHLLQVGVGLFLFTSLEGFAVEYLPFPRLGLSVHTLSVVEGLVLAVLGQLWNRLDLGAAAARAAFWLFLYSAFATLVPYVLAALWGAGGTTITLAAGAARGTPVEEFAIKVVLYSAAPAAIISLVLILWGLRRMPDA
jgi:hydroxylaminobenzene mutase